MLFSTVFWRKWHRWIGFPAALFVLFASVTGIIVAFVEFFGADEAKREALRDIVSPVTTTAPATAWTEPIARAMATVAARTHGAPVDKVEIELKGDAPTVTIYTGKPAGGEDKKFIVDARSGRLVSTEAYEDKPFLYRLHSGEAFGDGGLVASMIWGLALALLTLSGSLIYLHMYLKMRQRHTQGVRRFFW